MFDGLESLDSLVAHAVALAAARLEGEIRKRGQDAVTEVAHLKPTFSAALTASGVLDVMPSEVKLSFPSWEPPEVAGKLGRVDVVMGSTPKFRGFFELKWARNKHELGWTLWDIYKLAAGCIHFGVEAYAVVGAPVSYWLDEGVECSGLFCDRTWLSQEVFKRYELAWADLLTGGTARPDWVPARIDTRLIAAVRLGVTPAWELRALRVDVPDEERLSFRNGWPHDFRTSRVHCPKCGCVLAPRSVDPLPPSCWDDLVYRCDNCGWGYSNARKPSARRRIAREPFLNVPKRVRDGLDAVLDGAVNVRNRGPKRWKFCSEASEDAVTWTVVRGLQQLRSVDLLVPAELRPLAAGKPAVLLWGVAAGGPRADVLAEGLARVSMRLGERANSRTEPDVVLKWPELVLFVEAKLGSDNDRKPANHSGWQLYTAGPAFNGSPDELAMSGLYELVRNWRIGYELAGDLTLAIVNLGRDPLDEDIERLRPLLTTSEKRQLHARRWADVIPDGSDWLTAFAAERGLTT